MATVEKIITTRLENMILGQLEIGEHQAKCGALVHIIVIIVISITMMMEILVINIIIITSS